jgi:hypothetical protein
MANKKPAQKKFSDPREALKPKNFGQCPTPKTTKAQALAPQHHQHLEDFRANVLTGLDEVYRKFGPAHKKDATAYLNHCFQRMSKLLK